MSRNPRAEHLGDHRYPIRLVLDQTRLSQTNKLIPLDAEHVYAKTHDLSAIEDDDDPRDRVRHRFTGIQYAEEFVLGTIKPLHRYLIRIEITMDPFRVAHVYNHKTDDNVLLAIISQYAKRWNIPIKLIGTDVTPPESLPFWNQMKAIGLPVTEARRSTPHTYQYVTRCVDSDAKSIDDMVDRAREINYDTFVKYVAPESLRQTFPGYDWAGRNGGLTLKDDYHVRYFRSVFQGRPCVYVLHSAIEYVFCPPR